MEKIKLGQSDLHVSKICLGTMTFGEQNTSRRPQSARLRTRTRH